VRLSSSPPRPSSSSSHPAAPSLRRDCICGDFRHLCGAAERRDGCMRDGEGAGASNTENLYDIVYDDAVSVYYSVGSFSYLSTAVRRHHADGAGLNRSAHLGAPAQRRHLRQRRTTLWVRRVGSSSPIRSWRWRCRRPPATFSPPATPPAHRTKAASGFSAHHRTDDWMIYAFNRSGTTMWRSASPAGRTAATTSTSSCARTATSVRSPSLRCRCAVAALSAAAFPDRCRVGRCAAAVVHSHALTVYACASAIV